MAVVLDKMVQADIIVMATPVYFYTMDAQMKTLIEYVRLFQTSNATIQARKELLIKQRDLLKERIEEMQNTLERLNTKIKRYENVIIPIEDKLKTHKGK
jgi:DNA-binding transcriptional MerR regulator